MTNLKVKSIRNKVLERDFAILCLCASVLTGCINDENREVEELDKVNLTTTIGTDATHERANIGIDGKGVFTQGDRITVLYNGLEKEMLWNGNQWTPALTWSEIGGQATFTGFFPALTSTDYEFTHTVLPNQHQSNHFEESDLLFAPPVTASNGQGVNLNFKHLMSCLTVVLKGNRYTNEELQRATIQVKSYNKIQMYRNGKLGAVHDPDNRQHKEIYMEQITLKHKEGTTYQAIICPQGKIHDWAYGQGWWLRINVGGKNYDIPEPPAKLSDGTPFNRYEAGKNVTLTFSFNVTDEKYANKTCWISGLKNMPDINDPAWKFEKSGNFQQRYLPWKAEYGWYDCDKKSTTDSSFDDMNLCWAATSSNMIHWWMDQNRAYVDRYCQDGKKIPQVYNNHHDSEVFQLYKDKFTDEGSFIEQGLRWFFLGKYQKGDDSATLIDVHSGGYFKEVFGTNANIVEHKAIINYDDLDKVIKGALENKQAIGFAILMPGFGSAHALTIWGARFNEQGRICAIYYVENNDATLEDQRPDASRLLESRVGEYEGTNDALKGRACMENSQGKIAIQIRDMDLLNLMQEEWQMYFSKKAN